MIKIVEGMHKSNNYIRCTIDCESFLGLWYAIANLI